MKNPVLIPMGGIIIFLVFVGFLTDLSRMNITIIAIKKVPIVAIQCKLNGKVFPIVHCSFNWGKDLIQYRSNGLTAAKGSATKTGYDALKQNNNSFCRKRKI
ncbi:hypothetical protein [Melghirimyces algeriensis]|uniref:hypothetical protein n=1 Tax=Melghirimyces algeriensis TaxID=910412 RepID=UPI001FE35CEF|nr:hypothetical protein [Melghirimyces algeriensis]